LPTLSQFSRQHSRSDRAVCTRALLDRLEPPLALELIDLLARAFCVWRLPSDTAIEFADM
jgi:hypothetical protein